MADMTIEQLLDYTSFACAHVAHKKLVKDSPDFKKAESIVSKALVAIKEAVTKHYAPLAAQPGGSSLSTLINKAEHASSPEGVMDTLEDLAQKMLPWLRSHEVVFKDTFPGTSLVTARALTAALDETDNLAIISKISRIRPASRLLLVRRAIQEMAKSLNIEVSEEENLATDVSMVVEATRELSKIEALRSGLDPMSSEVAVLAEKEAKLEGHIAALSQSSSNPDIVQAASIIEKNKEPRVYASEMGKTLKMTPEQEVALMARGKAIIAAGAGSGKCVKGDTLIPTIQGFVEIQTLCQGLGSGEDREFTTTIYGINGPEVTSNVYYDGFCQTKRIETSQGYTVEGTSAHKILVLEDGIVQFKTLGDIQEGDVVCIDRRPSIFSETNFKRDASQISVRGENRSWTNIPTTMNPQVAALLGYIVSEGYIRRDSWNISLTTTDPAQYELYKSAARDILTYQESLDTRKTTQYVMNNHRAADVQALMGFGLTRTKAEDKEIPFAVLQSRKEVITSFLKALFDGDGGVVEAGVEYCTSSSKLAYQLHTLLLAYGVQSRRKFRPNNSNGAWHLYITGTSLRSFAQHLGFNLPQKSQKLQELVQKKTNTNVDVIPFVSPLCNAIRDQYSDRYGTTRTKDQGYGTYKGIANGSRNPSKETLRGFLEFYKVDSAEWETLDTLCKQEWFFDRIEEVTSHTADVYDFVVPETHSFSGGGFLNHNTRVIAGKVVYTINELGSNSGQIIATSFSKKSAKELKDRIVSYGGQKILDNGDKGFGTTHSIALSILKEYKPEVGKAKIMESDSYLLKLAMKQVAMYPERPVQDPVPVGMFDAAIAKALAQQGQTPTQNPSSETIQTPAPTAPEPSPINLPPSGQLSDKDKDFHKALATIRDTSNWALNMYPDAGWAKANVRLIDNLLSRGVTLSQLSASERNAINTMFNRPAALKALERKGLIHMNKVASMAVEAAAAPTGKTPYWNTPANQWFNIGQDAKDNEGRVIGPKTFSTQISKYRANMTTPSQAWAQSKDISAAVYGAYEWLKKNDPVVGNQMDFDDMLAECCRMLIENPTARTLLQSKFRHIFVDEAQDQNKMQHLLFGLLSGSYDPTTLELRKDGKMTADTYCLIGDDKQAIYEFRGAKPTEFIGKSDLVSKDSGFKTYLLDTNFRSGKNIVDAANRLISHNTDQIPMVCKTSPHTGEGDIHYMETSTHEQAASTVAAQIEEATKGETATRSYKDFGIALRTNAEAYAYGVEMLKRGIPFRSKMNFFNDSTTKALILWLSLAGATDKDVINDVVLNAFEAPRFNLDNIFRTTLQSRARGLNYLNWLKDNWDTIYTGNQAWRNRKNVYPYLQALNEIHAINGAPDQILTAILGLKGAEVSGQASTILDSLIEKVKGSPEAMDLLADESEDGTVSDDSIQALAIAPIEPLRGLLSSYQDLGPAMGYVKQLQAANAKKGLKDDPDAEDYAQPAVVIDTCHGWKGLETKHIFVSMPQNVFPHKRSLNDPEAMASERRLAYVALTRGQENVTVMCPQTNHLGKEAGPSQFIGEACIRPLNKSISEPEEESTNKTAMISPLSDKLLQVFASLEEDTVVSLEEDWGADNWNEMQPPKTDWENF